MASSRQVDLSQRSVRRLERWINRDLSYLQMDDGSLDSRMPGNPISGTMGVDYRWANGWLVGATLTEGSVNHHSRLAAVIRKTGRAKPVYGLSQRRLVGQPYRQRRLAQLLLRDGRFRWRHMQPNNGATRHGLSLAGEVGRLPHGFLTHGPVAGFILQQVWVDGLTETGGFTSLSFGSQIRNSEVSLLGYQASFDWDCGTPSSSSLGSRVQHARPGVTASLTTIAAPSYSMPAVVLGRDSATATVGTQFKMVDLGAPWLRLRRSWARRT